MSEERQAQDDFDTFAAATQDRVRRALVPVAGRDAARQATVDGLVYVWQNWERIGSMENPAGYLYTVARSRIRPEASSGVELEHDLVDPRGEPVVEPRLIPLLAGLPERQRVAVYLLHGCGWSTPAVAELLGISVSTVRNHVERALTALRRGLEVDLDAR